MAHISLAIHYMCVNVTPIFTHKCILSHLIVCWAQSAAETQVAYTRYYA